MSDNHLEQVELSLIVPVLNEKDELPVFFDNLSLQQNVSFELIICDGGSTDGGYEWLSGRDPKWTALKVVQCQSGRARQLNHGADCARGDWLLFLHVDSRFDDSLALRNSLDYVKRSGSRNVAGHFALTFRRTQSSSSLGYYFYEWKARLDLPETIHGDQGFLLHRQLFHRVGLFAESLTVMEDTDFAERLRQVGQWQLLPAVISTSARRFETEGLWQRQTLGALIMCFRTIGWDDFFTRAPDIYRHQSQTQELQLLPFFQLISELLQDLNWHERWKLWYLSGSYVRRHTWQLFFALDARQAFRAGLKPGRGGTPRLDFMMPLYEFLTDNRFGRGLASVLLRCWFELTRRWLQYRESH